MAVKLELDFSHCSKFGLVNPTLLECDNLVSLTVRIESYRLADDDWCLWRGRLSNKSMSKLLKGSILPLLRGLGEFKVTTAFCIAARIDKEKQMLAANVLHIQKALQKVVLLPKDSDFVNKYQNAAKLYPGSKVRWDGDAALESEEMGPSIPRVATPDISPDYISASTQTDNSPQPSKRPKYVSTSTQMEDQDQPGAKVDRVMTFDQRVAESALVNEMLEREARRHGGSAIAEGFPSFNPQADWLLSCRERAPTY
ncbi:hypothetical protein B0A48_07119 [Cryoendolithus antarcticus]|uniref:Uncharacterized protein n=1 Tax=Cryoendolithus antarcticus TaxID=1507870 RepID=A0A1V8T8C2_9PEZI|nr:hypothetical protein B0A48_07119 [Cryoendolithus antarcticus]